MSASSISANENPFAGYAQQPVRCRWLTPKNAEIAPSAGIIRLIVDKNRWSDSGWSNEVYNRAILREVSEFIGPTSAVIATPAGLFTTVLNQNLYPFTGSKHLKTRHFRYLARSSMSLFRHFSELNVRKQLKNRILTP